MWITISSVPDICILFTSKLMSRDRASNIHYQIQMRMFHQAATRDCKQYQKYCKGVALQVAERRYFMMSIETKNNVL